MQFKIEVEKLLLINKLFFFENGERPYCSPILYTYFFTWPSFRVRPEEGVVRYRYLPTYIDVNIEMKK
jgi:hypothetical protein